MEIPRLKSHISAEFWPLFPLIGKATPDIIGGIRVRIPQKTNVVAFWSWSLDVVVFQSWNLDVMAFCPLKKCLGIRMLWLSCLRFSMLWCFSCWISMSWFFGSVISITWHFGLGISMLWYMFLRDLVFVSNANYFVCRKLIFLNYGMFL